MTFFRGCRIRSSSIAYHLNHLATAYTLPSMLAPWFHMMEPVFSSTRSRPEASVTIVSVMHMYIIMYIHTFTHTYVMHMYIIMYIHTFTHTYVMHMYIIMYIHTFTHTYVMHMYIIMYIHTFTHTYVQTNVIAKLIAA